MCKNERIREGISFDPRKPTFNFLKINKRGGPNNDVNYLKYSLASCVLYFPCTYTPVPVGGVNK